MKALMKIKPGVNNIEIVDTSEPEVKDNEVKILVKAAGICGTDLHILHDNFRTNPPVILGHEFSGEIVETGKNIQHFKQGDRIVGETAYEICGICEACKTGNYNICKQRKGIGYDVNGIFTKYFVTKENLLHKIPDEVSYKRAALSEPLATCIHGVINKVPIKPGDKVVVTGPGPIGIIAAKLANLSGAIVILLGLSNDKKRFEIANEMGINNTIDIETVNPLNKVKKLTNDDVDVFIECSGSQGAVNMAADLLKPMGLFAQIGLFSGKIELDFNKLIEKEISITTSFSHNWKDWERAIGILKTGKLELDKLITVMDLKDWKSAFNKLENKKATKIVFDNFE